MTIVRIHVRDDSDLVVARRRVREAGAKERLPEAAIEALATAVTEIARNIVLHAGTGELLVGAVADPCRRGVVVTARDSGPGIPDVARAMQDGYSTVGGLGLGLPGAQRLVDEFEIESKIGVGTTITLRMWAAPERPR